MYRIGGKRKSSSRKKYEKSSGDGRIHRAQHLKIDELSRQDRESQSTVNQLTVQIEELQGKVNSLNDSRDVHDPETASSSRLSHVTSHPRSITSPLTMLRPDTRSLYGSSGHVFEDLPAPNEPTAACSGNARSVADAHCEPVSLNKGRFAARTEELERTTHNFATPTPRFARKFSNWNPPTHAEGAHPQNCMDEQPRKQVSEIHFDELYVPVPTFPRKLCCGSKMWRWSNQWTI